MTAVQHAVFGPSTQYRTTRVRTTPTPILAYKLDRRRNAPAVVRVPTQSSEVSNTVQVIIDFAEAEERATEAAARRYVSRLWAEDWDSDEDSVYDTW